MSFFSKAFKAVKSVAKSKVFQAAAGGLAVVFPPAGVPLAAGVAIANKVVDGVNSADAKIRAQAKAVIDSTKSLAAQGDVGAKRAIALMSHVDKAKKGDPAALKKLANLALVDKKRQALARKALSQYGITKTGRIAHKKTHRNLSVAR